MSDNLHLMIIDPQDSFCNAKVPQDQQQALRSGELAVPGAWEAMERVGGLVTRLGKKLDDIHITLDSHHHLHIAHPSYWRDSAGNPPPPFTLMRIENGEIVGAAINLADGSTTDIGTFHTVRPSFQKWAMSYLKALTDGNRYPHCVWPRHCIIGTPGHTVIPPMMEALLGWEDLCTGVVNKVTKGSNIHVEHFSAVRAEVPHPDDPHTQLNSDFVDAVMDASTILLSGIAGSHCLANTVRDVADEFAGADDVFIKKAILLEDGTAPVPGFEAMQTQFIDDMVARGMKKTTCANFLA